MADFQLPSDGSVIVIDDKIEEALPLIKLLSKKGIATTYYSGKDSELPSIPIQKVRLAFVDIQLFGPSTAHSYAQNILRILDTIISENNGPYILILWSTVEQIHADTIEEQLKSNDFIKRPLEVLRLEKSSFFQTIVDNSLQEDLLEELENTLNNRFSPEDMEAIKNVVIENLNLPQSKTSITDALSLITDAMNQKLKDSNAFEIFTIWENLINKSSGDIVKSYSELHQNDEFWEDNFKYSIYRMAHAQLGKTVDSVSEEDLIKNALKTFNHTFLDILENKIHSHTGLQSTMKIDRKNISFKKEIRGIEYKIIWKAGTGKYLLYVNNNLVSPGFKGSQSIEELIKKGKTPLEKKDVEEIVIDYTSIKPEINNRLLIDLNTQKQIQPGNVYLREIQLPTRRRDLLRNYFKKGSEVINVDGKYLISNEEIKKILFIEIEVTPLCDYVQGKWVKSRLLPGILVPEKYISSVQSPDSFYLQIPVIKVNGIKYKPIFDYRLFKSNDIIIKKAQLKQPLFRVRSELFADILSRLSSHINRVGIAYLE